MESTRYSSGKDLIPDQTPSKTTENPSNKREQKVKDIISVVVDGFFRHHSDRNKVRESLRFEDPSLVLDIAEGFLNEMQEKGNINQKDADKKLDDFKAVVWGSDN